jgi:hypothetical protein
LAAFLKGINAEAYRSLHEAGDELLALHRLNVPNALHRSLVSTKAIENSFSNPRRKLDRGTRFRAETDQASRWRIVRVAGIGEGGPQDRGLRLIAVVDHRSSAVAGTLELTPLASHFHPLGDENATRAMECQAP